MTDAELAVAIRKTAADHDHEVERMKADLLGVLRSFNGLVKEAIDRRLILYGEAEGHSIWERQEPLKPELRPIGAVRVSRNVEL